MEKKEKTPRLPKLWEALIPVAFMMITIILATIKWGVEPHIPLGCYNYRWIRQYQKNYGSFSNHHVCRYADWLMGMVRYNASDGLLWS